MKRVCFLISIAFCLNLISNDILLGQKSFSKLDQVFPISDPTYLDRNDIFLISNFDSIAQVLHVYAFNSTDTTAILNTYKKEYSISIFNLLIKDTSGKWSNLGGYPTHYPFLDYKHYYAYHNPESVKRSIPPNSYIWNSYSFGNRKTDFKTNLKLSITVNKQEIKLKPMSVIIDRSEALGMKETIIRNIDLCLSGKQKTTFSRKELILNKVRYLYELNKKEEAFTLITNEWNNKKNIETDTILYLKMKILLSLSKETKFSKAEKYLLRNAALTEYYKIKSLGQANILNENDVKLSNYFENFYNNLLSRDEWDTLNDLDCKEKDDNYFCYEKEILKDWVLIRFSNN